MFWLKHDRADGDETSWALPYGDLMSLLLAIFVMIAAMSELRQGHRFSMVSGAVRSAFGFTAGSEEALLGAAARARRLTLIEQLERAGLRRAGESQMDPADDALWEPCDVLTEGAYVTIRVAGPASFDAASAALKPQAEALTAQLAVFLVTGDVRLEVRGHSGDGELPEGAPFRDGFDLAYERARAVAGALTRAGVARERMWLTAWGDGAPLMPARSQAARAGANRRIEIIVHALDISDAAERRTAGVRPPDMSTAARVSTIAEKERVGDA